MSESQEERGKRFSRRAFLAGAAAGGAGVWAAGIMPRWLFGADPHRPPKLYEYFVDNYWFESAKLHEVPVNPPLKGRQRADIAIVGGGFAGMSSAYNLARRLPGKRIVLLEGARCGYGASGRNGGFLDVGGPGLEYVYAKQGPEAARAYYDATVLGLEQIRTFVDEYGVDCELEMTGSSMLAMNEKHLEQMAEEKERYDRMGIAVTVRDEPELRRRVHSERFVGALHDPNSAKANPAKLALGMKRIIESLGVEVSERSKVMRIEPGSTVRLIGEFAEVLADKVVIALNGYAPQIGLFKSRILPVHGWASATEPLSEAQMRSIGWAGRESLWDMRSTGLMYLRLSADNRIVFGEGGAIPYDASPSSGNYQPIIDEMQRSLLVSFPQLEGVRFTHTWGGTMAITKDGMPSVGTLGDSDNIFHAVAFQGDGVVMAQLAGRIAAELISGEDTPLRRLALVNKQMPYIGPEPIRNLGAAVYRILGIRSS
jgi:glycine/D-amino acid oxidase-like deaminating enzyme